MDNVKKICHPIHDHKLAKIVRDFLENEGIEVEEVENKKSQTAISWDLKFDEVEILLMLYKIGEGSIYLWFQTIVSRLDEVNASEVMQWLLRQNFDFPHPMKFALNDNKDAVILMMRVHERWMTDEHLKYRLNKIGPFVVEMQERLKRQFGLRPFREGQNIMPE